MSETTTKTPDNLTLLKNAYDNLKKRNGGKDTLKTARNAVSQIFPQVKSDNENAWRALKEKATIKKFYLEYITQDYATETGKPLQDAKPDVEKALHDFFNLIKGNPNCGGKNAFNNYLNSIIDYDITNDFQLPLFPANNNGKSINFPKSSLSFIAGRPSAGKTTVLVSIAMFAMRHTNKNVLFVTSEETPDQLTTRFIKNQFCDNCINGNMGNLLSKDFGRNYIDETFQDIIKKDIIGKRGTLEGLYQEPTDDFSKQVLKASKDVEQFIKAGRLQLYDLDKTESFEELKDALQEQDRYTIIIIDYMQNLPYSPKGTPKNDKLEVLRREIYDVNKIIKLNELIGIAGAQFNREGASEYNPDPLELKNLGDSGELERKAVVTIGLGRKIYDDNSKRYFYRILKNRYGEISSHFEIAEYYNYSYAMAKTNSSGDLVSFSFSNGQKNNKNNQDPQGRTRATNKAPSKKSTLNTSEFFVHN